MSGLGVGWVLGRCHTFVFRSLGKVWGSGAIAKEPQGAVPCFATSSGFVAMNVIREKIVVSIIECSIAIEIQYVSVLLHVTQC